MELDIMVMEQEELAKVTRPKEKPESEYHGTAAEEIAELSKTVAMYRNLLKAAERDIKEKAERIKELENHTGD